AIGQARGGQGEGLEVVWSPELGTALAEAVGAEGGAAEAVSEGGLARQGPPVPAPGPGVRGPLRGPVPRTEGQSFRPLPTAVVITGVLVVLQTKFRFNRGKDGRYTVLVDTGPTPIELLKTLVENLLSFTSSQRT